MDSKIEQLQQLVTSQKPEKADAIVWLQGNRYDRGAKVLELFKMKYAPCIVVTGNSTRVVEDDNVHMDDITEWLVVRGVEKRAIIIDDRSIHTLDQAIHVLAMAQEKGWKKILLVGSTYHQLRAFLTFLKQAEKQDWHGRIINQPAHIDWDVKPSGRSKTAKEVFQEEIGKLKKYEEDIATVKEGIEYFEDR